MYVDMACGRCESTLALDSEEEDPTWMLVNRFANAHAECGYMLPMRDTDDSPVRKVIKPRLTGDAGET